MFKNPFSFEGRIRRLEYGLSIIIYAALYFIFLLAVETAESVGAVIGLIILVPMLWFIWAQSAKRCHDVGRSGWWQLIPFYFLVLLFQDGDLGRNEYGQNPKNPQQLDVLGSETLDGHLRS